MNGRGNAFGLRSREQRDFYLRELQVGHPLGCLPEAVCRPCGIEYGGLYTVEEYFQHDGDGLRSTSRGFRLLWEGLKHYPSTVRLCCSVFHLAEEGIGVSGTHDWKAPFAAVDLDVAIAPLTCVAGIVTWMKSLRVPTFPSPYLAREEEQLRATSLSDESPGTTLPLQWQGCSWIEWCPPLRGPALISMAVALPPGKACPPDILLSLWTRVLPSCTGDSLCLLFGLPQQQAALA